MLYFFFFNDTATTEIYTLSYTTLFRSPGFGARQSSGAFAWVSLSTLPAVDPKSKAPDDWRTPKRPRAQWPFCRGGPLRSEEHTSELQSRLHLVCRLLLEKKKVNYFMTS